MDNTMPLFAIPHLSCLCVANYFRAGFLFSCNHSPGRIQNAGEDPSGWGSGLACGQHVCGVVGRELLLLLRGIAEKMA